MQNTILTNENDNISAGNIFRQFFLEKERPMHVLTMCNSISIL